MATENDEFYKAVRDVSAKIDGLDEKLNIVLEFAKMAYPEAYQKFIKSKENANEPKGTDNTGQTT